MGQGYYHKAFFMNVPHQGSPIANISVTIRDIMRNPVLPKDRRLSAAAMLWSYAAMNGVDFNQLIGQAIDDMSLGSNAVTNLKPFNVPTHAHVGTGGSDLWFTGRLLYAATKRQALAYLAMVISFTTIPDALLLYPPNVHDMPVLLDSQIGGLSNPNHYIVANFEDGLHESSFSSAIAGNRARQWATHSVSDPSFFAPSLPGGGANVHLPETQAWIGRVTEAVEEEMPLFAGTTVRITGPNPGQTVSSGDSFLVDVQPLSDVSAVVVVYPSGALFMDSTLTGYAQTPLDFNGAFQLKAVALMSDGTMGTSAPVTITVRPPLSVTLDGMDVTPSSVTLSRVGSTLNLRVLGNYSDDIQRDIASSQAGTAYSGFNPAIVSVSDAGLLRGAGPGLTSVTVQNSMYSRVVKVEVRDAPPVNNRPHAKAGGPYQACNGDQVALDASKSVDVDGDVLTYEWDLNGDGIYGDAAGVSPTFTPPYIVSDLIVSLRVTDSGGLTSEDFTTVHVPLPCFEGLINCAGTPAGYEIEDVVVDARRRRVHTTFSDNKWGSQQMGRIMHGYGRLRGNKLR